MATSDPSPLPPHVVVSYAHEEDGLKPILGSLRKHCKASQKEGEITFFIDDGLEPGDDFEQRIRAEFGRAQAAILLLGPAFQASDFIRRVELPLLRQRHDETATILYLLPMTDCNHEAIQELKGLHFAQPPSRPLRRMRKAAERDTVFAKTLKHVVKHAPAGAPPVPEPTADAGPAPADGVPPVPSKAERTKGKKAHVSDGGFLIAAEVVDYTDSSMSKQEKVLERLWAASVATELTGGRRPPLHFFQGLGDGILIAFSGNDERVSYASVFRCAEQLMAALATETVELRLGVHKGEFKARKLRPGGGYEVFGIARRVYERLAGIGDAGNIGIEESFFDKWCEEVGTVPQAVWPKEDPIEIFSRRRRNGLWVRVVGRQGDLPPRRLEFLDTIRAKIMSELEGVEEGFCTAISTLEEAYDADTILPRVSVWMPESNRPNHLVCAATCGTCGGRRRTASGATPSTPSGRPAGRWARRTPRAAFGSATTCPTRTPTRTPTSARWSRRGTWNPTWCGISAGKPAPSWASRSGSTRSNPTSHSVLTPNTRSTK